MIRSKVVGLNRVLAAVLAATWLCAGVAGVYFGLAFENVWLVACGALAVLYGAAWATVAVRSRLLSWRDGLFRSRMR
jgi:hypothetical protein